MHTVGGPSGGPCGVAQSIAAAWCSAGSPAPGAAGGVRALAHAWAHRSLLPGCSGTARPSGAAGDAYGLGTRSGQIDRRGGYSCIRPKAVLRQARLPVGRETALNRNFAPKRGEASIKLSHILSSSREVTFCNCSYRGVAASMPINSYSPESAAPD